MKTVKIRVFADPGHAWARFPKKSLVKLGIADKITHYSYQRGDMAFLEEDCDLSLLVKTLRDQGCEVKFDETHTDRSSKIRSYAQYTV